MGKAQKKTGKGRLDKYYKLAKEQGYRARSAFKLIQLNKKYAFLEKAKCCIDLCAAPGGWLQVASKYMPSNSIILGVDLVTIKPIPRVITFASDITTPQCRNLIRNELKDWKADVVLHDGAPNVGTAWVQDAYSQSELVLMSLKLAVEFLVKGGTFVTKVFRSVDYNSLIWVFHQLFGKVEATKPPSSRNVSAEIFVVCREFLAPKSIDPKFLDPKHVFKEVTGSTGAAVDKSSSAHNVHANVFQPEKKRRKREGYDEGDYTLFKKMGASEFVGSTDPVSILGSINRITFDSEEEKRWLCMDATTAEIKASCDDLKVLGKGDFKALLKWRTMIRQELGLDMNIQAEMDLTETAEVTEDADEDTQIQHELQRLSAEAVARAKRERRRANELRARTMQRMQLQMTAPMDIGMEQQDLSLRTGQDDIFDLHGMDEGGKAAIQYCVDSVDDDAVTNATTNDQLDANTDDGMPDGEIRSRLEHLEADLDNLYHAYQARIQEKDAKFKAREAMKRAGHLEEWHGIRPNSGDDEQSGSESEGGWDEMEWAKQDLGEETSSEGSEDNAVRHGIKRRGDTDTNHPIKRAKLLAAPQSPVLAGDSSRSANVWFSQGLFAAVEGSLFDVDKSDTEADDSRPQTHHSGWSGWSDLSNDTESISDEGNDLEVVPQGPHGVDETWDVRDPDVNLITEATGQKHDLLTVEAVSLAQQLVNREKTKTQLVNDGFNRYSLNSREGLPSWFLDDEAKHYKPNIPVTKEAVAALRARQRALDARPIKKVAEAKARKKLKATQRLEKAMKKAEGVNASNDMTEQEKAQQIEKLMRRGLSRGKKEKDDMKVVVAKGPHKGIKGRPKGVKGRYTMVDARMKKEVRAKKRRDKGKGRSKRA